MADEGQIIIIKRIKKTHGGAHGGSWKVAYADFVTAMMAFFLLLWLLSSVNEEELRAVADYFSPTTTSKSESGAGGMLGGLTIGKGAMTSQGSAPNIETTVPPPTIGLGGDALTDIKEGGDEGSGEGDGGNSTGKSEIINKDPNMPSPKTDPKTDMNRATKLSEAEIIKANQSLEEKQFEKAAEIIQKTISASPELSKLSKNLMIDNTPEGLRIQIVDQDGQPMFASGSAEVLPHTRQLLDSVSKVISQLPEKIAVSGHTDSKPFPGNTNYDNWDLSVDRALSTQHVLIQSGFPENRIERISGKSSTDPLNPKDPLDPKNRRITIVLLRNSAPGATLSISTNQIKSTKQ
jgi:chemotaxis protein MotB